MPGKLAAIIRSKYPGAYDDMDDATLEKTVLAKYPQYADLAKEESAPAPKSSWTETAINALPYVGGAIGGLVGKVPIIGTAAAALGGAAGEGYRQTAEALRGNFQNVPDSMMGRIRSMATAGAEQAGLEAGGRLLSKGLSATAGRLYRAALAPTVAARAEFPTLVETGLKNAVPVSKGGVEKAGALTGASKEAADALVANAEFQPNAPMIDPRHAVAGIASAVKEVRGLPVARPQMKAIGDYGRQYLAEHPGPMTLQEAQHAVRATDRYFDPAYRATIDRGNPVTSGSTAAAIGINDETRNLLRQAVPGLQEQNAKTRALMGLRDALERRTDTLGNQMPIGMRHMINAGIGGIAGGFGGTDTGLGTFATLEMLNNPWAASRLAIGANRAAAVPYSQAMRAAILAELSGETGTTR